MILEDRIGTDLEDPGRQHRNWEQFPSVPMAYPP